MSNEWTPEKRVDLIRQTSNEMVEVLDAVKEALVQTMNRFSIPATIMFDVAFRVLREAPEYQKAHPGVNKSERQAHLEHLVDEALAGHGYNTPDIIAYFSAAVTSHTKK